MYMLSMGSGGTYTCEAGYVHAVYMMYITSMGPLNPVYGRRHETMTNVWR
jgi:hypothetical protein